MYSKLAAAYLDHIAGIEWEGAQRSVIQEQLRKALDAANLPVTTNISKLAIQVRTAIVTRCGYVSVDPCMQYATCSSHWRITNRRTAGPTTLRFPGESSVLAV